MVTAPEIHEGVGQVTEIDPVHPSSDETGVTHFLVLDLAAVGAFTDVDQDRPPIRRLDSHSGEDSSRVGTKTGEDLGEMTIRLPTHMDHESPGLRDHPPEVAAGADHHLEQARLALHDDQRGDRETRPVRVGSRGDHGDRSRETAPETSHRVPVCGVLGERILVVDHQKQVRFSV